MSADYLTIGKVYSLNTIVEFNNRVTYRTIRLARIESYVEVVNENQNLVSELNALRGTMPTGLEQIDWTDQVFYVFTEVLTGGGLNKVYLPKVLVESVTEADYNSVEIAVFPKTQAELVLVVSALNDLNITYTQS